MALLDTLKTIFTGGNLIDSIGNAIDKNVTTDAEREALKNELTKIIGSQQQAAENELTQRLVTDMASDSWLSKNIRPMVLIFILLVYSTFSVLDGNVRQFKINSNYIELLGQWGMLIMSFYFGSRGLEKIFQIINNKK